MSFTGFCSVYNPNWRTIKATCTWWNLGFWETQRELGAGLLTNFPAWTCENLQKDTEVCNARPSHKRNHRRNLRGEVATKPLVVSDLSEGLWRTQSHTIQLTFIIRLELLSVLFLFNAYRSDATSLQENTQNCSAAFRKKSVSPDLNAVTIATFLRYVIYFSYITQFLSAPPPICFLIGWAVTLLKKKNFFSTFIIENISPYTQELANDNGN